MLATPGAGALSLANDVARMPIVRQLAGGASTALPIAIGQLPRVGIAAAAAGLIAGVLGAPAADPTPAEAQTANDVVYIYDALGRLRAVVDPASDTATYSYDAVGNLLSIGRQSSALTSVIEVSPGSAAVGSSVAVEGTGFSTTAGQNTVRFNGTPATVTSASATRLVVSVPSGATTGSVSVTAPSGTATSTGAFTVVASTAAPSISGFSPAGSLACSRPGSICSRAS